MTDPRIDRLLDVMKHRPAPAASGSGSIASLPDEKNEDRDYASHDKHPVLAFETQKGEMPNEKLHRFRPLFVQDRRFGHENILFLYLLRFRAGQA
jgi:hypothetical protein